MESLIAFFIDESDDSIKKAKFSSLVSNNTSTESRFSEYRCSKILPRAIATYKEGLPSHYIEEHHQAKVSLPSSNIHK